MKNRPCCMCRRTCPNRTARVIPRPSCRRRSRCLQPAEVAPSCCSPACARCSALMKFCRPSSTGAAGITRCCCRAKDRAMNCSRVFANTATRCCWAVSLSGKAWTCAGKPYPWSSSTSCPSPRRTIRCWPRALRKSPDRDATPSWNTSCRAPSSP